MSGWDAYVSAMVGSIPEGAAAIYGNGPVGLWFQSPGFHLTADQVTAMLALIKNPDSGSAFFCADKRFMKLQCEANVIIRGKSGDYACAAAVSNKAILICFGKTTPQNVGFSVEKYAADLKAKSF